MNPRFTRILCSVLTIMLLLVWGGCTLDDPPASDSSPALSLLAEENLSLTRLTWDRVQVTGFKEYIILQSTTEIPNSPTPPVGADVTVLKRIQEVETTSFIVSSIIFSEQMCYKVYCEVDDRFLYSPSVCVDQDLTMFPGFNDVGCHENGSADMAMFDRINDRLSRLNYETEVMEFGAEEFTLNFPSMEMSTWNNSTQVFATEQNAYIHRYNFPFFGTPATRYFSYVVWAVNAHENLLFAGTEEPGKGFHVLSRSSLATLTTASGTTGQQNIAVFQGDPYTVLVLGALNSKKYTVNANGQILSQESIPAVLPQAGLQSTSAEGNELFIGGARGTIINKAGENVASLSAGNNSFIQFMRLTPDEKTVVYVINVNGVSRLEYADISALPAVLLKQSIEMPSFNLADVIIDENIVYVVGGTFNSTGQTILLKYPLEL